MLIIKKNIFLEKTYTIQNFSLQKTRWRKSESKDISLRSHEGYFRVALISWKKRRSFALYFWKSIKFFTTRSFDLAKFEIDARYFLTKTFFIYDADTIFNSLTWRIFRTIHKNFSHSILYFSPLRFVPFFRPKKKSITLVKNKWNPLFFSRYYSRRSSIVFLMCRNRLKNLLDAKGIPRERFKHPCTRTHRSRKKKGTN